MAFNIGIQTIMPQTGTSPRETPPLQPANDSDSDKAAPANDAQPTLAPPPPGMGQYVDKLA